jgi:uncharacterized protein (DUF1778 family)
VLVMKPKKKPNPRVQCNFRSTAEEMLAFEEAAALRGMSLSAWIRAVCRKAAGLLSV